VADAPTPEPKLTTLDPQPSISVRIQAAMADLDLVAARLTVTWRRVVYSPPD